MTTGFGTDLGNMQERNGIMLSSSAQALSIRFGTLIAPGSETIIGSVAMRILPDFAKILCQGVDMTMHCKRFWRAGQIRIERMGVG